MSLAAFLSAIPLTAEAAFQYVAPPPASPTIQAAPLPPANPLAGAAATSPSAIIHGVGHDLPVAQVLRVLVPSWIKVAPIPPAVARRRVSFVGNGRAWDAVLMDALHGAGLTATYAGGVVTLRALDPTPATATGRPTSLLPATHAVSSRAPDAAAPPTPKPRPHPKPVINGIGHDLPLNEVLHVLVPGTMKTAPLAPALANRRVSFFGGGRPWDLVLRESLAGAGMTATITDTTVSIRLAVPVPKVSHDAHKPAPPPTWPVTAGSTLRKILDTWAARAGYNRPLWHAVDSEGRPVDWPIQASAVLTGTFPEAVQHLLAGFTGGSLTPVADIWPANRVLIVRSR